MAPWGVTRVRGQLWSFVACLQKHLGFSGNLGFCIASPCCGAGVVFFTSSRSPKRNRLGRSVLSPPPRAGGDRILVCCLKETQEPQESTNTKASWKKTSSGCNSHPTTRRFVAIEERPSVRSSSFEARWCLHDCPPLSRVTAGSFHFVFFTALTSTHTVIR